MSSGLQMRLVPLTIVSLSCFGCAAGGVSAGEFELIAETLELRPGMVVADVGAGEGEWSVEIARVVGEEGHVWATEITAEEVEQIQERIDEESLENVTAVLGSDDQTGLPAACCDAVLLRMVYHHFVDPEPMQRSLRENLRPGGILVVIDIRPENSWPDVKDVPERGGHGIEPADLRAELTAAGFEFVDRIDRWNGDRLRYCSVFRRGR